MGRIEKALAQKFAQKAVSKPVVGYPLTLKSLRNWVLKDIVGPCLVEARQHATLFVGETGLGKTPMVNAMASAIS
eukprot:6006507-Amphidinium_carterae.1